MKEREGVRKKKGNGFKGKRDYGEEKAGWV